MTKRVTITYNDHALFAADDVEQFAFSETDDGIQVTVKLRKQKPLRHSSSGGGLMDLLSVAGKSRPKPETIEEAG